MPGIARWRRWPRKPRSLPIFERQGYFCVDLDARPRALVFNRTVTLRDTWARIEKGQKGR